MPGVALPAQAVADLVGGRLLGNGATPLCRVAALDRAGPDALSVLTSARYADEFRASGAGAVLLAPALADAPDGPRTRIVVDDPAAALATAIDALYPVAAATGVDPTAQIGPGARWGEGVWIGPGAVLGAGVVLGHRCTVGAHAVVEAGVEAGDEVEIGPHVVVHRDVRLGHRVRLKAGAVIGGEGFGFHSSRAGHARIRHVGGCVLEDDVEVGSHTCVDRGSIGDTVVGRGTKIDNLVHVAHNVRIGAHGLVMAQVGIAGSTRLGDGVIVAGQAGVGGHLSVGSGVRIGGQSGVTGDVPPGQDVSGYPARPHREVLRGAAALPRLARLVSDLEAMVKEWRSRG